MPPGMKKVCHPISCGYPSVLIGKICFLTLTTWHDPLGKGFQNRFIGNIFLPNQTLVRANSVLYIGWQDVGLGSFQAHLQMAKIPLGRVCIQSRPYALSLPWICGFPKMWSCRRPSVCLLGRHSFSQETYGSRRTLPLILWDTRFSSDSVFSCTISGTCTLAHKGEEGGFHFRAV